MLSCIILAGSIFITDGKQSVRVDAINRIETAALKRISVEYNGGNKLASFFNEDIQSNPKLDPAQLVAQAIAPCEAKLASQ